MAMRDPARWWRQTRSGTAIAAGTGTVLCISGAAYAVAPSEQMFAAMPAGIFSITIALPIVLVGLAAWYVIRQQKTDNANRVSEGD